MIHIDEIQTEVQVEPVAADTGPREPQAPWQPLARLRQAQQRMLEDDARTSAWGNED